MSALKITILDFGIVGREASPSETLRHLVKTAPLLESLGYERLWVAEHHERHFCYAAPEVVIAAAAGATSRLRIGAAGVLMHFHSPLRVAETYRALCALYPGRIDLGLASGISGDVQIQQALRVGFNLAEAMEKRLYTQQVDELLTYLWNRATFNHALYAGPPPIDQPCPPIVMLGSGGGRGNMILAAKYGTAFCYSLAHGATTSGLEIMAQYRDTFQPSEQLREPRPMIAANFLCAENTVQAFGMFNRLRAEVPNLRPNIVGDPLRCFYRIEGLLQKYHCEEIVLFPMYDRLEQKEAGYHLLAEACGLNTSAASLVSAS